MDLSLIGAIRPRAVLVVKANGRTFYGHLENDTASETFVDSLSSDPFELLFQDRGVMKAAAFTRRIPLRGGDTEAKPGDIVVTEDSIALIYAEVTDRFSRVARIGNTTKEELLGVLGNGDVKISFSVEWSE